MKNKYTPIMIIFTLAVFILSACEFPTIRIERGSGHLATENRPVRDFNAIRLEGAGRLLVTQGETEMLEIVAEDNIIGELTSEVLGKTLVLGFKERPWKKTLLPTEGIIYNLSVIDLTEIQLNGAGIFETNGLETDRFFIEIKGASQVKIDNLSVEELSVKIDGTGTLSLNGQASSQFVAITGAGNYQSSDLLTGSTEIAINGLGNGTVWATETLDISIDGGGTVRFYGSPYVTQQIRGLGNIDNLGEK
jgi:hypothetical protein